jgi:hypothetical protein
MEGFNTNEVEHLKNMPKIFANRPIILHLLEFLDDMRSKKGISNTQLYNEVVTSLKEMDICEYTGKQTLDIPTTKYKLEMYLDNVQRTHNITFKMPIQPTQAYFKIMFEMMDNLVNIGMMYYKSIVNDTDLLKKMQDLFSDIDCSKMKVNKYTRSICLDESSLYRVGLQCRIIDGETGEVVNF